MTRFGRMLGAGLLLFPLLGGCGDDLENMPTREAVFKSVTEGRDIGDTKVGDLYGGKAVLSSNGATWWVKGEKVYSVNGIAMALSPGALKPPPSVSAAVVNDAVAGKAFPLPPNLGIEAETVVDRVAAQLAALGVPPLKGYVLYMTLNIGSDLVCQISQQETGGLATSVSVGVLLGKTPESPQRRPAVAVLATTLKVMLGQPSDDVLDNLMLTAIAGDQEQTVVGDKVLRFRRDKAARMVEVEITPAGGK